MYMIDMITKCRSQVYQKQKHWYAQQTNEQTNGQAGKSRPTGNQQTN